MSVWRGAVVLGCLLLVAAPAAAHGNYVSVDPQVSSDGTVRIELAVIVTDGFLAVHADANGEPGAVVGHRGFDGYVHADHAVELDRAFWANQTGNVSLWAALHRDTGDRSFDPADDPILTSGEDGSLVARPFTVRKATDGPVNVIAERDEAQETDRNVVELRAVRLATDGHVAIRADDGGSPGRVVGTTALDAGEHRDVTVTVDEAFYEHRPERFSLWAVVHASDGDDRFDASTDRAVTAGGSAVMTRFSVKRTDPVELTPTAVPADHTPGGTETGSGHGDHEHTHTAAHATDPASASAAEPQASEPPSTPSAPGHDHEDHPHSPTASGPTSTPGQPGFGFSLAVVTLVAFVVIRRRRP